MLVVDAERQRVEEILPRRQGHHSPAADDLAGADDIHAADGRNIALGIDAVYEKAGPVGDAREIRPRDHLRVLRSIGRDLIGETHRVTELPQVVVFHRGIEPRRCRVGRPPVVVFEVTMQRELVLHIEIDIDSAWRDARPQCRSHPAIRPLVERDNVVGDFIEVRHLAFLQRRRSALDLFQIKEARIGYP